MLEIVSCPRSGIATDWPLHLCGLRPRYGSALLVVLEFLLKRNRLRTLNNYNVILRVVQLQSDPQELLKLPH